jgi:multiple sugar transport system permease protein
MTSAHALRSGALRTAILVPALAVTLFPAFWMIVTSFKTPAEVFQSPPTFWPHAATLEAYRSVFATRPMALFLFNSLVVSLGATIVAVVLGALAAYGFSRFVIRGAAWFLIALLITKMLPETLLIVPFFKLFSTLGLIDTRAALILAYSTVTLPFALWMLIGFLDAIPRDIDEAAIVDGASRLRTFWSVIVPLARPGLVAVAFFTFIASWNSYLWALVLTTSPEKFVISVGVANMVGEYRVQWNELMAASVIATIPALILFSLFSRHLVTAITAGAVKG